MSLLALYSPTSQILDIDDEIAQPDLDRESFDHDFDPINERVSPTIEDVETVDFGTDDQPRELKIGLPLSKDERIELFIYSSHPWMYLHGHMRTCQTLIPLSIICPSCHMSDQLSKN